MKDMSPDQRADAVMVAMFGHRWDEDQDNGFLWTNIRDAVAAAVAAAVAEERGAYARARGEALLVHAWD